MEGLVCVTAANRRFCKPLCNNGFDFAFLRRSRLYDECSERTKYKWDSQYVGGNTLAVCSEALLQISGAKTAYFPENQTCLTTKSSSQHQSDVIRTFIRGAGGSKRVRRIAGRLPRMWRTMREKGV
ncbi:hypothetical protein fugu_012456 [Takifugu bimaculatus]|uniref:Uncharacterized protein n=1 Tax=Takifugu bimaculatus TaxID=433685 RepID=A0A4Z2C5G1_9TELE|nr:hypothetical protein fugu_012456 [Takifugu bimaculatus]